MKARPIVEMRGVSIAFHGVPVLTDVDFTLHPGEVHALIGENGAGKSTLVKALAGVYSIDGGEIAIDGELIRIRDVPGAQRAGIAAVHQQELGLCGNLTIGENVMLGNEVRGRWGIDWRRTHETAADTLAMLGLNDLDSRLSLSVLPPDAQQLVAVARAMVAQPRVLILDEPTSSLEQPEVVRLFSVIRRLRERGVAIVFVSHFLEQVYAISDRITILRDGRLVGEYRPDALDPAELIAKMLGKDIASLQAIGSNRKAHRREPTDPPFYRAGARPPRDDHADEPRALPRGDRRPRGPARLRPYRARTAAGRRRDPGLGPGMDRRRAGLDHPPSRRAPTSSRPAER